MRIVLLLGCSLLMLSSLTAQTLPAPRGCGFDHYLHYLEAQYPGFRHTLDELPKRAMQEAQAKDLTILTIPVVVHIVWQNDEQNLPDSQIEAVLDVLNEDYRRLNANAGDVRSVFNDVVGDPGIQFRLAGVERVKTDAKFRLNLLGGTLPDNVKKSSQGGSDAWDTDHYLNIWVCNVEGGSLLGYAYPPADLDHWPAGATAPSPELDGVVVHYQVFRRTGTYTTSGLLGLGEQTIPVRGRTITHEVGHYLGLRHIWGDGLLSILGIPDCSGDDGIADTPSQGMSSQFVCNPANNTCTDQGADRPDMFENFMDYAAEDCSNSFTKLQIAVMRSVLQNERSGLVEATTGTEDLANQARFQVFPNPVGDELTVQLEDLSATAYQLRLVDGRGRVVHQLTGNGSRQTIDVSRLPAGVYHLILMQAERPFTRRVVVW